MPSYRGRCLCGAVSYTIDDAEPRAMFLCHCSRCRKETGTMHAANVFLDGGRLTFEQGEDALTHFHLEGTRKRRSFCSHCGSPMPRAGADGRIMLPAGSVTDGPALQPTAHIMCDSRAEWEDRTATVPRFPGYPTG